MHSREEKSAFTLSLPLFLWVSIGVSHLTFSLEFLRDVILLICSMNGMSAFSESRRRDFFFQFDINVNGPLNLGSELKAN